MNPLGQLKHPPAWDEYQVERPNPDDGHLPQLEIEVVVYSELPGRIHFVVITESNVFEAHVIWREYQGLHVRLLVFLLKVHAPK